MKLNLQDKLGYQIQTKDGITGKVKDFLFDEEQWKLRYIDVDLGGIFFEQRVLIPVQLVHGNWKNETFEINLKSKKLKSFPELHEHQTVSREYEELISEHYELEKYWGQRYIPGTAPSSFGVFPIGMASNFEVSDRITSKKIKEDDINSSLRSFKEIQGYTIYAKNGKIGQLKDLIIESKDWEINSGVIEIESLQEIKNEVIVATKWMHEISYVEKGISLSLKQSEVMSSPNFDEHDSINTKQTLKEFDFRGKPHS